MSDRARITVELGDRPAGRITALLLTEAGCERLHDQGHPALGGHDTVRVREALELSRFTGKSDQSFPVSRGRSGLLWLLGCGARLTTRAVRRATARAAGLVPDGEAWSLVVSTTDKIESESLLAAAVEGLCLSQYRFTQGSSSVGPRGPCRILWDDATGRAQEILTRTRSLCEGVLLTRDLVNTPAADLGPEELAAAARDVANRHGMQAHTWQGEELLEQGFGLVEAVGRASARPSTFTVVRCGDPTVAPRVALVGKGVVFDSGGLNLKPTRSMLLMRKDMGGAGTVIGVLEALGRLGVDGPLLAVLPAAENMVGPSSFRPGDVLRSHQGKTVEIGNTDAEGRLLLADGISYAVQQNAARIVDLATLTGAARVALGPDLPALFGTDEEMVASLLECSAQLDEPLWRLPLVEDYDSWLDTPFADVNHVASDSRAGAITAALFLRRFVGDVPWSHIDLYGWEDKGRPETPKGANGMVVRSLVRALEPILQE